MVILILYKYTQESATEIVGASAKYFERHNFTEVHKSEVPVGTTDDNALDEILMHHMTRPHRGTGMQEICNSEVLLHIKIREGCKKSKWKFKRAFPIRRLPPPPLNGTNFQTFFTPLFFFCN